MFKHKSTVGSWAFIVHRLSGIALAMFLPLHFWALSRALNGSADLDAFLEWTKHPLVQAAEWGVVLALGVHLAGGLRIAVLEILPSHHWRNGLGAVATALIVAMTLVWSL